MNLRKYCPELSDIFRHTALAKGLEQDTARSFVHDDDVVARQLVLGVRTYLNYHIKCTKAFLHTRMRDKVTELHKVLKAAYPQNVKGQGKKKKKKKKDDKPKPGTRHGHSIRRHI